MALYYLDAQDANFPYQVVQKSMAGDGYIGQMPMSASLVAYSKGSASQVSQVMVLPMGGLSSTSIQFNQYDWAACLPTPAAYTTDAEIMAYLSTLFTGQLGTLVPPTPPDPVPQVQYLYTNPIEPLALTSGTTLFVSVSGGIAPSVSFEPIITPLFESTLLEVKANVPTNDLDSDTVLSLRDSSLNIYATATVSAAQTGLIDLTVINPNIAADLGLFYVINPNPFVTSGSITISSIRSEWQLPLPK